MSDGKSFFVPRDEPSGYFPPQVLFCYRCMEPYFKGDEHEMFCPKAMGGDVGIPDLRVRGA